MHREDKIYFLVSSPIIAKKKLIIIKISQPMFTSRNSRTVCEICSKLRIKTQEWRHWCSFAVFIANFEQISHIVLVLPLVTFRKYMPVGFILVIASRRFPYFSLVSNFFFDLSQSKASFLKQSKTIFWRLMSWITEIVYFQVSLRKKKISYIIIKFIMFRFRIELTIE